MYDYVKDGGLGGISQRGLKGGGGGGVGHILGPIFQSFDPL